MMDGTKGGAQRASSLTLSSPVMQSAIIFLILSFICYNFFLLERVNSFHPKKCYNFFGPERVNPFQPPKFVAGKMDSWLLPMTREHVWFTDISKME
jgi:hypothetical protein